MEQRYTAPGYIIHDSETEFTLNVSGAFTRLSAHDSVEKLLSSNYKYVIDVIQQKIKDIEDGNVVNHTVIKEESEDRAVDHYNLRMKNSPVQGKSLDDSIQLWKDIQEKVHNITNAKTKNKVTGKPYKYVIFNGIGGSYLGPLLLVSSMKGLNFNQQQNLEGLPNLYFVSNTDPESFQQFIDSKQIDLSETLFVNMSKSGGTAETRGNMNTFNRLLLEKGITNNIGPFNIAITTKGSKFDKFASENDFLHTFYMNEETGGRTSVVSAIGMVPCAFAHLDFEAFLKGQSKMDEMTRRFSSFEEQKQNPALITALVMDYLQKCHGRKNLIVLGYSDALREFAHYLQQLYMESLGKQFHERTGAEQPEGQTLFGGIGTGEQHAFMQQVQKGLNDCIVKFVHFLKRQSDYSIMDHNNHEAAKSTDQFYNSMGRQFLSFVKGTENALYKNGKPFMTCQYRECNMFNMGMMVALEERIVSILGAIKGVNAYDQPGVQDGKESANDMNKYGDQLERHLTKYLQSNSQWQGDATQAKQQFDTLTDAPIWYIDAILADIYANYHVPNAYPRIAPVIKQVSRKFENNRFIYTFQSKL